MPDAICTVAGCGRKYYRREWCRPHWKRWDRTGDIAPDVPIGAGLVRVKVAEERFWAHVQKTETCWLWSGSIDRHGYGSFYADGKDHIAHVWIYRRCVGEASAGLVIDHVEARGCTSRRCVNLAHLEVVTPRENVLRGRRTKISDDDALRAWKLYQGGSTQSELAGTLGVSQASLSRRFKKLGLRP